MTLRYITPSFLCVYVNLGFVQRRDDEDPQGALQPRDNEHHLLWEADLHLPRIQAVAVGRGREEIPGSVCWCGDCQCRPLQPVRPLLPLPCCTVTPCFYSALTPCAPVMQEGDRSCREAAEETVAHYEHLRPPYPPWVLWETGLKLTRSSEGTVMGVWWSEDRNAA